MKELYLAIEDRLGKIGTLALFIVLFLLLSAGVLNYDFFLKFVSLFIGE